MSNNDKKKSTAWPVAIISVLSLFVAVCCAYLITNYINPEFTKSVKENFSFLYQITEKNTGDNTDEPEPENALTCRMMFAGNNTIYRSIYTEASKTAADGTTEYDFTQMYANVKGIISLADAAAVTQTSVLSGEIAPSTEPNFCTPLEAGDALYDCGFRIINHATTHVFDKEAQGVADTLAYWSGKQGATVVGLYNDSNDMNTVKVVELNGIKVAVLAFTESINASLPSDSAYYVLNFNSTGQTKADALNDARNMIRAAKEQADAVVCIMNFNPTQSSEVTSGQSETVKYLVSFGADAVIGTGNNRIQPFTVLENDEGKKIPVAYSLGNFFSAENYKENMPGVIADLVFEKTENGTTVRYFKAVPVVTYYEKSYCKYDIIPFASMTEEKAKTHQLYSTWGGLTYQWLKEQFDTVITPEYLESEALPTESLVLSELKADGDNGSENEIVTNESTSAPIVTTESATTENNN